MQLFVFVLRDPDRLPAVLAAWAKAGATGVTVLESTGSGHLNLALARHDVPLFPSMLDIAEKVVEQRRTLFTITDDAELVRRIAIATQEVVGDCGQPHTGIIFTVPISMAIGVKGIQHIDTGQRTSSATSESTHGAA
jgi:hypothetical protein